ncbi:MAG: oligosaccharide flippase family protein [Polyangiaceae bacterium]|nr:oligosaccharide flippase family protein [Polyangiaceae bacterium]
MPHATRPEPPPADSVPPLPLPAPPGAAVAQGSPPAATAAQTAGRGGLAIAGAKVSFILFGFVQQLILPRLIGVDGYGEISRVLAIVGIVNNVVVATSIQGVSRAVAAVPEDRAAEAFGRTLRLHAVLAIVLSAAFALSAGAIASFMRAPHITTPLRLVGAVVLLYGIYAPLVGSLNGLRRFVAQAALDVLYGAMRMGCIAAGAILFLRAGESGVLGAAAGFVTSAALIVPIAGLKTGIGRRGDAGPTAQQHLAFLLPLAISQIFLNLLLQTDFMIVSRIVGDTAARAGLGADAADELVGVYRGVQLFAFLSYQLLVSVTFILFPMLAKAQADGDSGAVRRYTMTGMRIALLLAGLMCAPISGLSQHVLRFAFPVEIWSNGGEALRILSIGMGTFAVLGVESAALTSLRRERTAAALTATTVVLVASGCLVAIPMAPFGPRMLVHSAAATSAALAVASIAGAFVLRSAAGGAVAALTPVRVGLAVAAAVAAGSRMPWVSKPFVLVEAVGVAVVYVVVLAVTGEIGRADLGTLKQAFGRRGGR